MRKIIYSMLALAMTASVFTSCEDVPEPYMNPNTAAGSDEGTATGTYLSEAFQTDGLGKFTVKNVKGTEWKMYQTKYAVATGYDNATKTTTPSESYLVSPEFDLTASKEASMQFEYIYRYKADGTVNRVLITLAYTGDPATTQWEDITGTLVEGSDWTTWTTWSNNIPAAYVGKNKVVVALHYACEAKSATWEVKNLVVKEGKVEAVTPSVPETPAGEAKGDGTAANPYNAFAAHARAAALSDKDTIKNVYVTGVVSSIGKIDTGQFGNAEYKISEDGTTTSAQFSIFRGMYLDGAKFTSTDQLKVGQKVVVVGNLINYKGNTPQMAQGSKLISIDGEGASTTTPVQPEDTGEGMSATAIVNGKTGDVALADGRYGTQNVGSETTWYTWTYDNIVYKGAKIAKAEAKNGSGIQMQGEASDAAKQGFLFNETAFGKDIKEITVVLKVVETSQFEPSYSLYAGTAANPGGDALNVSRTFVTENGFKVYTDKYDLSAGSFKHFKLYNNKVGALYIDRIIVTLK